MTNTNKNEAAATKNPPVAKIRVDLINASIWKNPTDKGIFYNVTFESRYRDGEGNWKSSHSYTSNDLLALAKAADLALHENRRSTRRIGRCASAARDLAAARQVDQSLKFLHETACGANDAKVRAEALMALARAGAADHVLDEAQLWTPCQKCGRRPCDSGSRMSTY